jgi:glutamyl-tRNA synthetase
MTVRTRFAPSPTGYLHIGGVRTALFNYLFAKQHGGQFLLRIDDTDEQRNVQAALQPILDGFRWLGMQWDEGPEVDGPHAPYFQSQRKQQHAAAAEKLLASGHAYRDYSKPEELQVLRSEAEKAGQQFVYDRRWMANDEADIKRFEAEGRVGVVRLKIPREGHCRFHDAVRGDVEFAWSGEADHVIQRADGSCLYHLASVVDDFDFQISHVIRAVEHLPNTPRQIFIAQSLGYPLPVYAHLPYVAEPNGTAKLSKRKLDKYLKDPAFKSLNELGTRIANMTQTAVTPEVFNPVVVDFYREIGFLPWAILNYLLMLGWSLDDSTEEFTLDEAIKSFSLERIQKSPASFDPQKLVSFQSRWMSKTPIDTKLDMIVPMLKQADWIDRDASPQAMQRVRRVIELAGDRIRLAGDIFQFDELFVDDSNLPLDDDLLKKRLGDEASQSVSLEYVNRLQSLTDLSSTKIEADIKSFVEQKGIKLGVLMNALRIALTGKSTGLAVYEYIELLGIDTVVARVDRAIAKVKSMA